MNCSLFAIPSRYTISTFLFICMIQIPGRLEATENSAIPQASAGGPSSPLPVSLGIPEQCLFTESRALNSGAYPQALVIPGSVFCPDAGDTLPYLWRNGTWSPIDLPDGDFTSGYAESVNDEPGEEPTVAFHAFESQLHWQTWVKSPGGELAQLDLLADMTLITNAIVSPQGNYVVGGNHDNVSDVERAVRWTREASGWSSPEDIGPGQAVATTEDGSIVIGNTGGQYSYWGDGGPWVWTANTGGGGELTMLEPEAIVYDITHTGSMIVGARAKACTSVNCDYFAAPVYWVVEDGQWIMHDLEALDGVESEAQDVAEVNGQPTILGYGYTNQNGGILRVVVWIPEADGSYGAPLRLEALGGNFDSWSWPIDINRNGLVLGWSEKEPFGATNDVVWNLLGALPFQINAGLNDAWFNPATPGQGFFINVLPDIGKIFLGWFTYDTNRPDVSVVTVLGDAGHRWFTAIGSYFGSEAVLDIEITQGGVFDSSDPEPGQHLDGTITLEFTDCNTGLITYDIPSANKHGSVPIERLATDNVPLCNLLAAQVQ